MALVQVSEQGHRNRYNGTITEIAATRYFVVVYDAPTSVVAAAVEAGVPAYGDPHPDNAAIYVQRKQGQAISEDAGRHVYEIQCDYSSAATPSPLNVPVKYRWDFSEASERYFFDKSDPPKPVVNSSGEPFDEIPERETGCITVAITQNNPADYPVQNALQYRQLVNSGALTIDGVSLTERQAKVSGLTVSETQYAAGVAYREVQITLKLKKTWDDEFADMGYHELGDDGQLKQIVAGTPPVQVAKPYPLDGSGHKMSDPTGTPATLTFQPYDDADLSTLLA